MTDDFIYDTGHDRRLYTRLTQLCNVPQNTLKIHGRVLWHIPVTTDDFIYDTGHDRRLYTRLTQLCDVPQNTLKIHGRVLWHIPVTTDDFVNVSHNYWGSGRPASVSDTTTTAVLCPPSGLWIRLHVWSRSDLIQSFNQYRNNIWLYYTRLQSETRYICT